MPKEAEAKEASPEFFQAKQHNPLTAWHALLDSIRVLAQERDLRKKAFISYTWPLAGQERDVLQAFLKRLQNDFERAGIETFLDVRGMQGNMDVVMRNNLEASDFVLPILTPAFLARVEGQMAKPNNLQFEFQLMMEKAKANPACVLPVLHAGEFCAVIQGSLAPLAKQLVYRLQANTRLEPYLVGLSDPLGLIPVMYGIQFNDTAYQALHLAWLESSLTYLPQPLRDAIPRENQMAALFHSPRPTISHEARGTSSIQVIQGRGGVGKTQLAILYANRQIQKKEFVRWMMADKEHLETEWQRLGELLGLDLKGNNPIEEQHRAIQAALSQRKHWLLVLDNVENKAALEGFLPQRLLPTQQVLITTRSQHWGDDPVLVLTPFTLEECQAYFETRLASPQCVGVEELSQELGALPLAIAHATAYLKQTDKTAKSYLQLYREKGIVLLAKANVKSEADETDYNTMILTMYQLSITALASQHPQAAELVKSCAYFHPEGIKKSFLKKLLNIEEEAFDDGLRAIQEYSLLSKGDRGFNMHRWVQQIIRHQLSVEERERQMTRVVECLTALNPDTGGNAAVERRRKAIMPHLETVITHHAQSAIENEHLALALSQLGSIYLYQLSQPQKSIRLGERALAIFEVYYGHYDPYQVAITLANLGNAYGALGDNAQKRDFLERALKIQEAYYGKEHYQVASTLVNLGTAYGKLGDIARKRYLLERALAIEENHYGLEHYQVAITLVNLGNVYGDLGDTALKRDLLKRALVIFEAHYGQCHSELATTLTHLAVAYHTLKQRRAVLQTAQRAYRILMNHPQWGADHPRTKQCIGILQSDCQLSLKDLQSRKAISDTDASALNHYPGTMVNQGQRRRVGAVSKEEKAEPNNLSKQKSCCVIS